MGDFLRHDPCPRCGSRDNLGVYTDGQWCFGCGFRIPGYRGMSVADLRALLEKQENKKTNDSIRLPADFSTTLPPQAISWLKQYNLTDDEITKFHIGWSDEYESRTRIGHVVQWPSIIFPAFDIWGNLLVYQRRSFNAEGFPKYHTTGSPESVLWTVQPGDKPNDCLVLVEDFVSALKVGRQFETAPLWGSNLSFTQITRISDRYSFLILWLDQDKTGYAAKLRLKALPFFREVLVVSTEKDPKSYDDDEIRHTIVESMGAV
jgi:hypothetical protein